MALAKSQRSLKAWGKQKWRTKSGKKSSETGERYLPEKAIKALSSAEYAATTRAKRRGTKKGQTICEATERDCKKNSENTGGIANARTLWKNDEKEKSNKKVTGNRKKN